MCSAIARRIGVSGITSSPGSRQIRRAGKRGAGSIAEGLRCAIDLGFDGRHRQRLAFSGLSGSDVGEDVVLGDTAADPGAVDTWAISIPCSSAIRRTTGDERARSTPSRRQSMPWRGLTNARTGTSPVAPFSVVRGFRHQPSATADCRAADCRLASSITAQIPAPTGTVVSGSTRISTSTPETGDGISALTLSVSTSTSGSYFSIRSPTCFSQLPDHPSSRSRRAAAS